MTTNDLVAALQETLSRYQQNGTQENDITQHLENQLNDLKATVAHLQASLSAAHDEKRLLLEALTEQSQQLSRLTQLMTPAGVSPSLPALSAPSAAPLPEVESPPAVSEETKAPTKSKSRSPKKAEVDAQQPSPEAEAPVPSARTKKAKPEASRLDTLWEKVRDYNTGKPNSERVKFDESLAMKEFGFTPEEWDTWYQGSNRAKVKRQPAQLRSNKRQSVKEAIATLKQDWVTEFPDSPVASHVTPPAATEPDTAPPPAPPEASPAESEPAPAPTSEAIAPASKGETTEDNLNALLQLFQSWNSNEVNPSVRLTPYTATSFGFDVQQARDWMDAHQQEIDQLNEGVPPNNRREARGALNRLKETWALVH